MYEGTQVSTDWPQNGHHSSKHWDFRPSMLQVVQADKGEQTRKHRLDSFQGLMESFA